MFVKTIRLVLMIILAESGSSKTDWVVINEGDVIRRIETIGLNPYHVDERLIQRVIEDSHLNEHRAESIYFFGAGCSTQKKQSIVEKALSYFWPGAEIDVKHDVEGAALACYDGKPCVVGILGTGSNVCYFDGQTVVEGIPAMGFILGDEGGGSFFGSKLLSRYFQGRLSTKVEEELNARYDLSPSEVKQKLYSEARPNFYLASFMPFIYEFRELVEIADFLGKGFRHYLKYYIQPMVSEHNAPIYLVGSVAHFFEEEIRLAAGTLDLRLDKIIRHPMDKLIEWVLREHIGK